MHTPPKNMHRQSHISALSKLICINSFSLGLWVALRDAKCTNVGVHPNKPQSVHLCEKYHDLRQA